MEARDWKDRRSQLDAETEAFAQALAVVVNRHRMKLGWPPELLALEAGISRETVRAIELNENTPNLKTVFRVARAMDIQPRKLIAEIEKEAEGILLRNGDQKPSVGQRVLNIAHLAAVDG